MIEANLFALIPRPLDFALFLLDTFDRADTEKRRARSNQPTPEKNTSIKSIHACCYYHGSTISFHSVGVSLDTYYWNAQQRSLDVRVLDRDDVALAITIRPQNNLSTDEYPTLHIHSNMHYKTERASVGGSGIGCRAKPGI